jgi:hypothetical protein
MDVKENNVQEDQYLFQMLYNHFNSPDVLSVKYNEEDPHTWPSNWKRQAPLMIIIPDTYLDSRPHFNNYQRQLVRRLSLKYQPLVQYFRHCIKTSKPFNDNFQSFDDFVSYKTKPKMKWMVGWNKLKKILLKIS